MCKIKTMLENAYSKIVTVVAGASSKRECICYFNAIVYAIFDVILCMLCSYFGKMEYNMHCGYSREKI